MKFTMPGHPAIRATALITLATHLPIRAQSPPDVAQQIAQIMSQAPSGRAHQRYIHAKGVVCEGSFEASPEASAVSRAAHLAGGRVPITVRFSDGAPDVTVSDSSADASPRGMAIRFESERPTDIMAISHNGFVVGTGEEFLSFQKALEATDASGPHPTPIEVFLRDHPRALKFVHELNHVPVSFATESFYSNNALMFINTRQEKHAGRYQIVPIAGTEYLSKADLRTKPSDFLRDELKARLANMPVRFRLLLQLADSGDQTNDGSVVWPENRQKVDLGIITITSVVADAAAADRALAFDPTRLVDGIELSDDPLPALRARVYAYSVAGRRAR